MLLLLNCINSFHKNLSMAWKYFISLNVIFAKHGFTAATSFALSYHWILVAYRVWWCLSSSQTLEIYIHCRKSAVIFWFLSCTLIYKCSALNSWFKEFLIKILSLIFFPPIFFLPADYFTSHIAMLGHDRTMEKYQNAKDLAKTNNRETPTSR